MTKQIPIIFSALMVRALLEGKKTQIRGLREMGDEGDILLVLETFVMENTEEYDGEEEIPTDGRPIKICDGYKLIPHYRATEPEPMIMTEGWEKDERTRWTSPIFMPRWASRIQLRIKRVYTQALQSITQEDARQEGVDGPDYRANFAKLWNEINKKCPWELNPIVYVHEFEVIQGRREE